MIAFLSELISSPSHYHCDHIGDVSTFPKSTELVVGPDFKDYIVPGYPTDKDAPIRESDYEGRPVRQIEFDDSSIVIGQFRATDYFGDGSFYLLDSPGVSRRNPVSQPFDA